MKVVVYKGTEPTSHPQAGILKPGPNTIADDRLADRLLEAGKYTGDFEPPDTAGQGAAAAAAPYHAAAGDVHHLFADCTVGNNIEPANRRRGKGGKPLCRECAGRQAKGGE
jgi:hypothetical protein